MRWQGMRIVIADVHRPSFWDVEELMGSTSDPLKT
jgi:hypothetical protein